MAAVLVVDDQPELCRMVERILAAGGHRPRSAVDGLGAVAALAQDRFDVALVDYGIPPPDGLWVLNEIRLKQPACARVLMSGSLAVPMLTEAVNCGEVTRILTKPFDEAQLTRMVDESLHAHRQMETLLGLRAREADAALHQALTETLAGAARLAVQPIVQAMGSELFAYELLLRSTHPVLKGPMQILDAAERCDRVADVAETVARLTCAWMEKVPPDVRLFVNLHPRELEDTEALRRRLDHWRGAERRIVVEITERSAVTELEQWETSVKLLGDRGFPIAVDDVGSGYNSLSVLAELDPLFLKVDMSIVRNVHQSPRKRRLLEMLCRFGEATGTTVITEGIECEEEAEVVRASGAHLLQGYHFGRPTLELPGPVLVASTQGRDERGDGNELPRGGLCGVA
ncbi:MAG: EAL domain-containing response regulator [Deltaproteobacteria bacterium]|nr:EAL domain-containing response regulator [Deltaproteobacteria bacterium]